MSLLPAQNTVQFGVLTVIVNCHTEAQYSLAEIAPNFQQLIIILVCAMSMHAIVPAQSI
jgi:hypothetical protein